MADIKIAKALEEEVGRLKQIAWAALERHLSSRAEADLNAIRAARQAIELLEWAKTCEPRTPLPKLSGRIDPPNPGVV